MARNKLDARNLTEDPRYHDTWKLLKRYRDVVWSLGLSVLQVKNQFRIEYDSNIEDFLETVYMAGADLTHIFPHRSLKMWKKSLTRCAPTSVISASARTTACGKKRLRH